MKIDIEDDIYPEQLRKIENPPIQLFYRGNIDLLKKNGIAIVGTRNPTEYGERMAKKFSKELSEYGIVVISGLANGIDSCAHIASLNNTIAILPSGFKNIYPDKNADLLEKIIENNGLIITEYADNEKADSKKFIERNRIVSGLAIGTLVIEGGYRSGTSITAKLTKRQGKNIFCIPSNIESNKSITPNNLIKEGAFLVTRIEDIINKYPKLKFTKIKNKENIMTIKDEYSDVYNILNEKGIHINEIVKKLKKDINEVSYKLMMLELEDKIVSLPGNNYKKI